MTSRVKSLYVDLSNARIRDPKQALRTTRDLAPGAEVAPGVFFRDWMTKGQIDHAERAGVRICRAASLRPIRPQATFRDLDGSATRRSHQVAAAHGAEPLYKANATGANVEVVVIGEHVEPHDAFQTRHRSYAVGETHDIEGFGTDLGVAIAGRGEVNGIAFNPSIVSIPALDARGAPSMGLLMGALNQAEAHQHATNNPMVVLLAFQGELSDQDRKTVAKRLGELADKGIAVVVPVGDGGADSTINPLATLPCVMPVTALDTKGTLAADDDTLLETASRNQSGDGGWVRIVGAEGHALSTASGTRRAREGSLIAAAHATGLVALFLDRARRLHDDHKTNISPRELVAGGEWIRLFTDTAVRDPGRIDAAHCEGSLRVDLAVERLRADFPYTLLDILSGLKGSVGRDSPDPFAGGLGPGVLDAMQFLAPDGPAGRLESLASSAPVAPGPLSATASAPHVDLPRSDTAALVARELSNEARRLSLDGHPIERALGFAGEHFRCGFEPSGTMTTNSQGSGDGPPQHHIVFSLMGFTWAMWRGAPWVEEIDTLKSRLAVAEADAVAAKAQMNDGVDAVLAGLLGEGASDASGHGNRFLESMRAIDALRDDIVRMIVAQPQAADRMRTFFLALNGVLAHHGIDSARLALQVPGQWGRCEEVPLDDVSNAHIADLISLLRDEPATVIPVIVDCEELPEMKEATDSELASDPPIDLGRFVGPEFIPALSIRLGDLGLARQTMSPLEKAGRVWVADVAGCVGPDLVRIANFVPGNLRALKAQLALHGIEDVGMDLTRWRPPDAQAIWQPCSRRIEELELGRDAARLTQANVRYAGEVAQMSESDLTGTLGVSGHTVDQTLRPWLESHGLGLGFDVRGWRPPPEALAEFALAMHSAGEGVDLRGHPVQVDVQQALAEDIGFQAEVLGVTPRIRRARGEPDFVEHVVFSLHDLFEVLTDSGVSLSTSMEALAAAFEETLWVEQAHVIYEDIPRSDPPVYQTLKMDGLSPAQLEDFARRLAEDKHNARLLVVVEPASPARLAIVEDTEAIGGFLELVRAQGQLKDDPLRHRVTPIADDLGLSVDFVAGLEGEEAVGNELFYRIGGLYEGLVDLAKRRGLTDGGRADSVESIERALRCALDEMQGRLMQDPEQIEEVRFMVLTRSSKDGAEVASFEDIGDDGYRRTAEMIALLRDSARIGMDVRPKSPSEASRA